MIDYLKARIKSIEDPKKRLELLLRLSTFVIAYFYTYVYQNMLHINIGFIGLHTLIQMPIIALVVLPLIHFIIIKSDPLQRSPRQWKPIRFFQNEFPSKYILERCRRCIENENSCPNYIKKESYAHLRHWFHHIFHGPIEREDARTVKDTFEKGYTCKLLYYLSWILFVFLLLAIGTVLFHHICLYLFGELKLDLRASQILFALTCLGLIVLIKGLNKPDEKSPSGCWQAWREINRMHVSWLKSHEEFLVKLICQEAGGTKKFVEK